jgi:hypothetical protein
MLAGVICGAILRSPLLVALSLAGSIGAALWISHLNVSFGRENPAAALMEGGHFLQFQQMQLTAAKGRAPAPGGPATPAPPQLAGGDRSSLPEGGNRGR